MAETLTEMEEMEGIENQGISFVDFPEDVQFSILSFLSPSEISSFCQTSKRFAPLGRNDSKLWFSLCDRRWGSETEIRSWSRNGEVPFHVLYKNLHRLQHLIGFWRRIDRPSQSKPFDSGAVVDPPALVFFEWAASSIVGYEVRSTSNSYGVSKRPFLWIGLSHLGETICYLNAINKGSTEDASTSNFGFLEDVDVVSVNVSFVGENHFVVEENLSQNFPRASPPSADFESSPTGCSPPDEVTADLYQYFANRTSPSWIRACRRQRRKERMRQGRRFLEAEHYVKIVNDSPIPGRPLQGLWKGLNMDQDVYFYIVTYDDVGGIVCRRVGDTKSDFSAYSPVFWTSSTVFMEPPFSRDERALFHNRRSVKPFSVLSKEVREPSRILHINSSYDLVIPDLAHSFTGPSSTEGRIWQYNDGTFAFGFLQDHFYIDMQPVALDGHLLDAQ